MDCETYDKVSLLAILIISFLFFNSKTCLNEIAYFTHLNRHAVIPPPPKYTVTGSTSLYTGMPVIVADQVLAR